MGITPCLEKVLKTCTTAAITRCKEGGNARQQNVIELVGYHCALLFSGLHPSPMRLYVDGFAGSGKTWVINTLKKMFKEMNVSKRVRSGAYVGQAASLLGGSTLHSLLSLSFSKFHNEEEGNEVCSETTLQRRWLGVEILIIDEISMVGANFIAKVHTQLCRIRGSSEVFGGLTVLFFGDFSQLPPVLDSPLWHDPTLPGHGIWRTLTHVIRLEECVRQGGDPLTCY